MVRVEIPVLSVSRCSICFKARSAMCPFHSNVTIRVGDDAAETHAHSAFEGCGLNQPSAHIGSYFVIDRCSPEPIGHGQGTVWRHDVHVDEHRNANNQEAEQKCGDESSGSPPARCPTLKHWEIALSCHLSFVGLKVPRGLSLGPCVSFDNYSLAYSSGSLGLGCCFFLHPAAPRQLASGHD
jgi:hypothetical protein